jgi:hypothetical protein
MCGHNRLAVEYTMDILGELLEDVSFTTSFPLISAAARHASGTFILEVGSNTVVARSNKLRVVLPVFNDMPIVSLWDAEEPLEPLFTATYSDCDAWFKRAVWAADERSERAQFAGPHLLRSGERGAVVASDTRVMVVYFVEGASLHTDDIQLPIHFLSALGRVGVGEQEMVVVSTNEKHTKIIVQAGDYMVMASPLFSGQFPALWKSYVGELEAGIYESYITSKSEITSALKTVMDLTNAQQHSNTTSVKFEFDGGECDMQVVGAANEIKNSFLYSVDGDTHVNRTISLDPALIAPFLNKCSSEEVVFNVPNVTSSHHPVVINDGVLDAPDYRCIVAPMRG